MENTSPSNTQAVDPITVRRFEAKERIVHVPGKVDPCGDSGDEMASCLGQIVSCSSSSVSSASSSSHASSSESYGNDYSTQVSALNKQTVDSKRQHQQRDDSTSDQYCTIWTQPLRKGKWTTEESAYVSSLIHYFKTGFFTLPCAIRDNDDVSNAKGRKRASTVTLRNYIASQLNCDPVRVSKKYPGEPCLNIHSNTDTNSEQPSDSEKGHAQSVLAYLENNFHQSIQMKPMTSRITTATRISPPSPSLISSANYVKTVTESVTPAPLLLKSPVMNETKTGCASVLNRKRVHEGPSAKRIVDASNRNNDRSGPPTMMSSNIIFLPMTGKADVMVSSSHRPDKNKSTSSLRSLQAENAAHLRAPREIAIAVKPLSQGKQKIDIIRSSFELLAQCDKRIGMAYDELAFAAVADSNSQLYPMCLSSIQRNLRCPTYNEYVVGVGIAARQAQSSKNSVRASPMKEVYVQCIPPHQRFVNRSNSNVGPIRQPPALALSQPGKLTFDRRHQPGSRHFSINTDRPLVGKLASASTATTEEPDTIQPRSKLQMTVTSCENATATEGNQNRLPSGVVGGRKDTDDAGMKLKPSADSTIARMDRRSNQIGSTGSAGCCNEGDKNLWCLASIAALAEKKEGNSNTVDSIFSRSNRGVVLQKKSISDCSAYDSHNMRGNQTNLATMNNHNCYQHATTNSGGVDFQTKPEAPKAAAPIDEDDKHWQRLCDDVTEIPLQKRRKVEV